MVSVTEATSIILSHLFTPKRERIRLHAATGRYLAESITADRDMPPFDRATMDGIAVSSSAFKNGNRTFKISKVHAAGQPRVSLDHPEHCIEIMTGAILPEGTDTIVRYEDLKIANGTATIQLTKLSSGENIHFKGMDAKEKSMLLTSGQRISPAEIALLASVGKYEVEVFSFPITAVISTGDELIPIERTPAIHQIRQSNAHALASSFAELGCPTTLVTITDQKEEMESRLKEIIDTHDLIILSGGVSKGKFDFVPPVLESLGIRNQFHGVSQKPGKPFWFGTDGKKKVFALPGNPVSTFMCFYRYIRPWLIQSFGANETFPTAILAANFSFKPALTYFLQVKITSENGRLMAYPDAGGGSGDFANLKAVDGFLELPLEKTDFKRGDVYPLITFRSH